KTQGKRTQAWYQVAHAPAVLDEAHEILAQVGLRLSAKSNAAALSHGDKKRLELAMTIALRPRILMLDEPAAGMAPSDRLGIVDLIQQIMEQNKISVLLTEHDMDVVFRLANRVAVLNYGQMIAVG